MERIVCGQFFLNVLPGGDTVQKGPVVRVDPVFKIIRVKSFKTAHMVLHRELFLKAAAHPVGLDLVGVQISIENGFIVYAQPFNQFQMAQVFLVDHLHALIVLVHQSAHLLFPSGVSRPLMAFLVPKPHPFLRGIPHEHIEHIPRRVAVDKMSVIVKPAHLSVLCDNAVFHIIQVVLAGRDLRLNAFLYCVQIIGVNHSPEGIAGELLKFLQGGAVKDTDQSRVGI